MREEGEWQCQPHCDQAWQPSLQNLAGAGPDLSAGLPGDGPPPGNESPLHALGRTLVPRGQGCGQSRGRASRLPKSRALSWPFLPCLAEWEGFFSRRTSTLPERGHRQSVPSHLCPAAWRKRDLSRPRMSTCAQERRDRAKRMGAPGPAGTAGRRACHAGCLLSP